jgi:AcrR family transcriptional regulator
VNNRANPPLSPRKVPRQARSKQLVADILEAAIRVLARDGARRFTTVRVAEEAGVSVGSLYQYFPNKEALLFRLQTDEWHTTGDLLGGILADRSRPPFDRLRAMVRAFFRSEREEAQLRVALGDAAPLYRDAPETREHRARNMRRARAFTKEALPGVPARQRAFAADVVMTTMSTVGKKVSEQQQTEAEVDAWAEASADMYCAYLRRLVAASRRKR